jgi:hypothetical protein
VRSFCSLNKPFTAEVAEDAERDFFRIFREFCALRGEKLLPAAKSLSPQKPRKTQNGFA